jgi:hypothetical protein
MNPKARLLTALAAVALVVAVLAVTLAQCGARPAPDTETLGAVTATIAPAGAATEGPDIPVATPGAAPTLTREEELLVERQHYSSQSASSPEECGDILKAEPWCNVARDVVRIKRTEWEELLPQAEFFLIKYDVYGSELGPQQRNLLIVEQDGQRYTIDTFDRLLAANGVAEITNESRELVAKAFALMTLADYLEGDVVFTDWMEVDWWARTGRMNYGLVAWTQVQGLKYTWGFMFKDGQLREVRRNGVAEYHTGDYIDVSFYTLPLPSMQQEYRFGGGQ